MGSSKGAMQRRHASLSILHLLLAKALRAPLWLLLSAAFARVLEPQGLGNWSMILAAAMFLNQILLHWTQSVTQRFGRREWLDTQALGKTLSLRALLLAPGLVLLFLLLLFQPFNWPKHFYGLSATDAWFVLPMVLALWLMAEVQGVQQVREHFGRLAWSPLLADMAMLCILAMFAWSFQGEMAEHRNAAFHVLSLGSLTIWLLWLANEVRGIGLRWQSPGPIRLRQAAGFAMPMIPGVLIGYLSEWGDYFLIRYFYSETEVGLFHPAYQYLLILVGLPTALASVILPKLVAAHDSDGGLWMRNLLIRHAPQFCVIWGIIAFFVSAILPSIFKWLVGGRYGVSTAFLEVMAIAIPGAVYQHIYGVVCFAQNRLWIANFVFFGIKAAINITLSIILLPKIGVWGSVIGCAVSFIVLQWLFVIDQNRNLKVGGRNAVCSLLYVQLAGIAMAFFSDAIVRIGIAVLSATALLIWARRRCIFSADEVGAVFPGHIAIGRAMKCLLCRKV